MLNGGRPLWLGAASVGFRVRQRRLLLGSLLAQFLVLAELFPQKRFVEALTPSGCRLGLTWN